MGAVAFGGYSFFQNQRLQLGPLKTFLFIRPVSTQEIAHARIVVVLRSVLISFVPFVVACAVAVLLAPGNPDPTEFAVVVEEHMDLGGVGIALLLLFGSFAVIWCFQWYGDLLTLLSVLGIATLFLLPFFDFDTTRKGPLFTAYGYRMTALVAFAASAYAFYLAIQRGLVEKKSLYFAVAAWPWLVLGFAMWLSWGHYVQYGGRLSALLLHNASGVLAFAVLPLAPLATVPLVMQYTRHR